MIATRSSAAKAEDTRGPREVTWTPVGRKRPDAHPGSLQRSGGGRRPSNRCSSCPGKLTLQREATQSNPHFQRNQAQLVMLPLDPTAPLVSSASSVRLFSSASGLPSTSSAESLAAPQASRPMYPEPQLCVPSSPLWPVCPGTPPGSLFPPDQPQSVVAHLPPWTSESRAVPRPSTPSVPLGSSLPLVSP
ncbi:hypothetical protein PO909_015526 [Leuciscus waleckii]